MKRADLVRSQWRCHCRYWLKTSRPEYSCTFDGPDAYAAKAFLGTVRERHLIQSAGRYPQGPDGVASVYEPTATPDAGEVELPKRGKAVATGEAPGQSSANQYYTWNVSPRGGAAPTNGGDAPAEVRQRGAPPSPAAADGIEPRS